MWIRTLTVLAVLLVLTAPAYARRAPVQATVADPYIEIRSGPGRGYPIFYVADRGAQIEVLMRRTDWFQVKTDRGVKGWVRQDQLARTLSLEGQPLDVQDANWDDFSRNRWEMSLELGDFGGANAITANVSYRLTPNIATEISATQITGNFSDGWMGNVRLLIYPFPEWRVTPFVTLGTGVIQTNPKATLVGTKDRTDQVAQAGIGVRAYLTRRFLLRADYSGYVVFTSRNDNQEVEEWKAGFAYFF